jgi:hypothetical protein
LPVAFCALTPLDYDRECGSMTSSMGGFRWMDFTG